MIAKKEWFKPWKFAWIPKSWDGWVYYFVILLLVIGAYNLPLDGLVRVVIATALIVIFFFDFMGLFSSMYDNLKRQQQKDLWMFTTVLLSAVMISIITLFAYRLLVQNTFDTALLIILLIAGIIKWIFLLRA